MAQFFPFLACSWHMRMHSRAMPNDSCTSLISGRPGTGWRTDQELITDGVVIWQEIGGRISVRFVDIWQETAVRTFCVRLVYFVGMWQGTSGRTDQELITKALSVDIVGRPSTYLCSIRLLRWYLEGDLRAYRSGADHGRRCQSTLSVVRRRSLFSVRFSVGVVRCP